MKNGRLLIFIFTILIGVSFFYFGYLPFKKKMYAKVPVHHFSYAHSPIIEVEIEGEKYLLEIDLGSSKYIALRKEVLGKIQNKKEQAFSEWYDIKGNSYRSPQFLIPLIKIENFKARPVFASEESVDFLTDGCQLWPPNTDEFNEYLKCIHGRVGINLFEEICLYLDLPHSMIFIAKDRDALSKEKNFSIEGFTEVAVSRAVGATIVADTDLGPKRFMLDTGASISILRDSNIEKDILPKCTGNLEKFTSDRFVVGGIDFGSQNFYMYNFSDTFTGIDGFLGMDFIKKHAIFLDLKNNKAFIDPRVTCTDQKIESTHIPH